MHDPHLAAAAAGGLDAPGLSPSDLQLNARLCRILAERFPEAMEIPSGETRVLELRIGSRQDGALTAPPGSSSPRQASGRAAQPSSIGLAASDVDSAGGSSQPRRTLAQLRRVRPNTLTPAEKLHRLSHPVSATAAGSRRKPHQPPDQPYSIPFPGEEGHEEAMELLAGDDLGAVSDGELLRLSAVSSRQRRHRHQASSSVTPSSAAKVARPASATGDEASFDFDLEDPMGDVELDASVEVGVSVTSSTGIVSTTGTSSVVAATSSPVTATSSTTVTTVVSAAPTVDSAVVSCTAPRDSSVSMATSSSAATASSSAVLVSTSSCSTESASADSNCLYHWIGELGWARRIAVDLAPSSFFPTSGIVTSAPSSADPVVASAPILSSTLTSTPLSSTSLVASSTASSTVMSIPASSSAIAASLSIHYLTEFSVSDRVALGLGGSAESSSDSTSRGAGSSAKPLELLSGSSDAESDSVAASSTENESSHDSSDDSDDVSLRDLVSRMQTGRIATHGKAQSYLALGRAPPSSPRSSDSAGVLSAQRSSSAPKTTKEKKERRKHKHRHKRKHKSKHRHKHKHRLSDLENSAGSAGDADPPRRSERLASSDSAGCPRPSKKSRRDLPPSSSRLSNHSTGASPVVPSSLPSTAASVGVTPHPEVHSTPALPVVLRVSYSTLQTRAAQAASRDSRITPQNARLHDLPFLHFGSTRCWKAILERQTGQIVRAGGDRSRIPPTPSSIDGLRAFADVYNPDHPSQLLRRLLPTSPIFVSPLRLSEARTRLGNSARASSLMKRLAELWVKLGGETPSPTKPGNSASLARDDHPTRYFVALWERTHWVVESSVMMGLHPSRQASRSYEEIADMNTEWFRYKLCRKRRSGALRSLMATISDDLYSAVVKSIDGVPAPDVDAELYFEPSVPMYPLVNLSWIPGGSDWCQAVSEVDSAEPWRVDPNIVEAEVEDDVDLTEPDPPIRSTSTPPCANRAGIHIFERCGPGELGWSASDSAATARSARDARDGSGDSPPDSIFGPDSPDLAGSLSSALGSSVGASSQASSSAGQRSRTGNSAGHPVQGQDSAMDMLVSAASAIFQAPSPNAPVTL
ncbi:unnamed protein product [Phytophthora fragariaefolia]|uniref:Unnamed protein product n=1 Tax=Phytophthora fragariaefolia TaxID=1490495 RepID=A0A9W7D0B2_9STRA|nr:unnamed protein product [Phytophthora fragariaefolia]